MGGIIPEFVADLIPALVFAWIEANWWKLAIFTTFIVSIRTNKLANIIKQDIYPSKAASATLFHYFGIQMRTDAMRMIEEEGIETYFLKRLFMMTLSPKDDWETSISVRDGEPATFKEDLGSALSSVEKAYDYTM